MNQDKVEKEFATVIKELRRCAKENELDAKREFFSGYAGEISAVAAEQRRMLKILLKLKKRVRLVIVGT